MLTSVSAGQLRASCRKLSHELWISRWWRCGATALDLATTIAVTLLPALFPRLNPLITVREPRSTVRYDERAMGDTGRETTRGDRP